MKTILLVLFLATAIYAAEKISLSGKVHQFLRNKFHKKPEVTPVVENSGFSDNLKVDWDQVRYKAHKASNEVAEGAKNFSILASDKLKNIATFAGEKLKSAHEWLKNKIHPKKPEATETSGFGFSDFIKSPHHHHKWNQTLNHTKNATKSFFHHHAQKALDWVKGIFGHHNKSNHTFNHSQWNHSHHHHNHTRLVEESGVLVQAKNFLAAQGKKIYDKIKSFGKKPEVAPPAPEPEASGVVTDNLVKIKDSAKGIASAIKDKVLKVIGTIKSYFGKKKEEVAAPTPAPETSGWLEIEDQMYSDTKMGIERAKFVKDLMIAKAKSWLSPKSKTE